MEQATRGADRTTDRTIADRVEAGTSIKVETGTGAMVAAIGTIAAETTAMIAHEVIEMEAGSGATGRVTGITDGVTGIAAAVTEMLVEAVAVSTISDDFNVEYLIG